MAASRARAPVARPALAVGRRLSFPSAASEVAAVRRRARAKISVPAAEPTMIQGMNHFTVLTDDLDGTLRFYVDGLGLKVGPRPDLGFPGAWLYVDDAAVLHVIAGRALPASRAGVLDHMAFSAQGLKTVKTKLDAMGVAYDLRQQRGSGTWQLFCHDPSGAKVELDFDPAETA
jgi:catechol 2,3-dioxygenase-like lactoylglutathione lyase family enzyme